MQIFLSLGAIDFGIIVDASVVICENIVRRFAEKRHLLNRKLSKEERLEEIYLGATEVARAYSFWSSYYYDCVSTNSNFKWN